MILLFGFLSVLWLVKMVRSILFWIYLWQLKEYHIGRFIDHFRTSHGKALFINPIFGVKIVLFILLLIVLIRGGSGMFAMLSLVLLYGAETAKSIKDAVEKKISKPVFTTKTIGLTSIALAVVFVLFSAILFMQTTPIVSLLSLVAIDVFSLVIVSAIVLAAQPIVVLRKSQTIAAAKEKRQSMKNLQVIGITGSYGKTTTKEILFHILSSQFSVVKTPEHQNSEIGIARTILGNLQEEHQIFICEMGAYNKGGIKYLSAIAQPTIGVITGVNEQHLATFGSIENLYSAEGGDELAVALPPNSPVIMNADSAKLKERGEKEGKQNIWVSRHGSADLIAKNIRVEKDKVVFTVSAGKESAECTVTMVGAHNIENVLLAMATASGFGMSLEAMAEVCKSIPATLFGTQLRQRSNGVHVLDGTYSANSNGVIADIEHMKLWSGKKLVIMPCLIELGSASSAVHKKIGEKIAEAGARAIITTKECFSAVQEGAGTDRVRFIEDVVGIQKVLSEYETNDVVLLESRLPKHITQWITQ